MTDTLFRDTIRKIVKEIEDFPDEVIPHIIDNEKGILKLREGDIILKGGVRYVIRKVYANGFVKVHKDTREEPEKGDIIHWSPEKRV